MDPQQNKNNFGWEKMIEAKKKTAKLLPRFGLEKSACYLIWNGYPYRFYDGSATTILSEQMTKHTLER